MWVFQTRSALVMAVIALLIGIGAGAIFASQHTGQAFAEDGETEIDGIVEALPATGAVGTWRVSGRNVIVTQGTEIDRDGQTLAPGLRVEIEGYVQPDGTIVAEEIEVRDANDNDGPTAQHDDDGPSTASSAHAADDDD